jgi:hypothetical protein
VLEVFLIVRTVRSEQLPPKQPDNDEPSELLEFAY